MPSLPEITVRYTSRRRERDDYDDAAAADIRNVHQLQQRCRTSSLQRDLRHVSPHSEYEHSSEELNNIASRVKEHGKPVGGICDRDRPSSLSRERVNSTGTDNNHHHHRGSRDVKQRDGSPYERRTEHDDPPWWLCPSPNQSRRYSPTQGREFGREFGRELGREPPPGRPPTSDIENHEDLPVKNEDLPRQRKVRHRQMAEQPNNEPAEDGEIEAYKKLKIQPKTVESLGRTGGVYIPPFKLAQLQNAATDKSSPEYQRQSWDALRKSINGLVNKVNTGNITNLVQDLFRENLVRGRGLIARSIIRAQMASPGFTNIYAALLSILNSKLPELGDLILRRVLLQFRRAYRRNDKIVCSACVKFFAHLVNQRVLHELFALQLPMLLLEKLTDDSVDLCVTFVQEVGQTLSETTPKGFNAIFERLRTILQEGEIDKRIQYPIEQLFNVVKSKFADFPGIVPELDLVEQEDQITHEIDLLEADVKGEEVLNIFKEEPPEIFLKNEAAWTELSTEILGGGATEGRESLTSEDSDAEEEPTEEMMTLDTTGIGKTVQIRDMTEQDIINLRRTIYLTIMSSASFEECVHKILKLNIKEGAEIEVCTMLIDCNAMERTFQSFFALQADRFCRLKPVYQECFLGCLKRQYETLGCTVYPARPAASWPAGAILDDHAHNRRRWGKYDALPWSALELFVLTESATTSASRIFIKIVFQELAEHMGLRSLYARLHEPMLAPHLQGIFPTDHPKNIRFSINFFTAIGLGALTSSLRELLITAQSLPAPDAPATSSSSSSSDSEDTSSDSED